MTTTTTLSHLSGLNFAALTLAIASLSAAIWLYLVIARGGFWRAAIRDDRDQPSAPQTWPSVAAIVPARNEADVIAKSMSSLLAQDYPGPFRVILVDDQSQDGTGEIASGLAAQSKHDLHVVSGQPLPQGWAGKVWAMKQGVEQSLN